MYVYIIYVYVCVYYFKIYIHTDVCMNNSNTLCSQTYIYIYIIVYIQVDEVGEALASRLSLASDANLLIREIKQAAACLCIESKGRALQGGKDS